jgi:hypothetical protein
MPSFALLRRPVSRRAADEAADPLDRTIGAGHMGEPAELILPATVWQGAPLAGIHATEGRNMLKKVMATAAITLSVAATGATMAPQAMAVGSEEETTALSGNGSSQAYGNFGTAGDLSAQAGLIQGTLNKPCVAVIAGKLNVGSVVGLIPITVQDILTSQQVQACAENSTEEKGDDFLSHILENVPILSANGVENE